MKACERSITQQRRGTEKKNRTQHTHTGRSSSEKGSLSSPGDEDDEQTKIRKRENLERRKKESVRKAKERILEEKDLAASSRSKDTKERSISRDRSRSPKGKSVDAGSGSGIGQ